MSRKSAENAKEVITARSVQQYQEIRRKVAILTLRKTRSAGTAGSSQGPLSAL